MHEWVTHIRDFPRQSGGMCWGRTGPRWTSLEQVLSPLSSGAEQRHNSKYFSSPYLALSYRASFHFQVRHHSGHKARCCARLQADAVKASGYRNHRADQERTLPSPTSGNSKGLGTQSLCLTGDARLALALPTSGEVSNPWAASEVRVETWRELTAQHYTP